MRIGREGDFFGGRGGVGRKGGSQHMANIGRLEIVFLLKKVLFLSKMEQTVLKEVEEGRDDISSQFPSPDYSKVWLDWPWASREV